MLSSYLPASFCYAQRPGERATGVGEGIIAARLETRRQEGLSAEKGHLTEGSGGSSGEHFDVSSPSHFSFL